MLEDLYSTFLPMFRSKNLEFYFSVSKNIPETVYGDSKRTEQILTNILSNGLKYTPEGHVEFYAWMSDDSIMHVSVHDTGIGIRPEDIKKLFKPFEQLDIRKSKNVVGTGLGLSISHRLIELMNGKLWVESTYGTGTTVFLDIPCIPGAEGVVGESVKIVEFSAKDAKVLVVDDIDINLTVAEAMLQIFDITPDLAIKGSDAVAMAKKKKYDVIFMDQMMPEMDGFETMRLIREIGPEYKDTPVVALTANVINNAEKMFLENGFNGFLAKPIEIHLLNLCLRKFLPQDMIKI
jgi:CheY-like chemotaxis protein